MAKRFRVPIVLLALLGCAVLYLTLLSPESVPVPLAQRCPPPIRRLIATNAALKSEGNQVKQRQEAQDQIKFALSVDSDNPAALRIACELYEPSAALSYCWRLVAVEPKEQAVWDELTSTLKNIGGWEDADAEALRQIQSNPCDFGTYSSYWESLRSRGKRELSIPMLRSGELVRDDCDPGHKDTSFAHFVLKPLVIELIVGKRYEEAVEAARLLVAETPETKMEATVRHLFLAIALQKKGDLPSANAEYERAEMTGPCEFVEDKGSKVVARCANGQ